MKLTLFPLILLALAGTAASLWVLAQFGLSPWVRASKSVQDLPWVAPGEQAREFLVRRDSIMSTTGATSARHWGTRRHRVSPEVKTFEAIAFLARRGAMATWPRVGEGIDPHVPPDAQRDAPCSLHLVSIDPVVIVLRPDPAYGEFRIKRDAGTIPWPPEPAQALWPAQITNPVFYGTSLPHAPTLQWFSADLDQSPAAVEMTDADHGHIALPRGRLAFTRAGGEWRITRE